MSFDDKDTDFRELKETIIRFRDGATFAVESPLQIIYRGIDYGYPGGQTNLAAHYLYQDMTPKISDQGSLLDSLPVWYDAEPAIARKRCTRTIGLNSSASDTANIHPHKRCWNVLLAYLRGGISPHRTVTGNGAFQHRDFIQPRIRCNFQYAGFHFKRK